MKSLNCVLTIGLLLASSSGAGEDTAGRGPSAEPSSAMAVDSGRVVFFREKSRLGAAVRFKVRENGKPLGKLSNGTFFVVNLSPGVHHFVVHSDAEDVLTLEVESGDIYYLRGSVQPGLYLGRPNLAPSTSQVFEGMKPLLRDVSTPSKNRH
jgi:hypothetical protein